MANLRAKVTEACQLKAKIDADQARLDELKKEFIKAGQGTYTGESPGESVQVIFPAPSIRPDGVAIEAVKKAVGAEIFGKLFTRIVKFSPDKGFRSLVGALLTPAKSAKVLALCEVPTSPRILIG